jgi:hypothetical protein
MIKPVRLPLVITTTSVLALLALSGCGPPGPPVLVEAGNGEEARSVSAVSEDRFAEELGPGALYGSEESEEIEPLYYLFDPLFDSAAPFEHAAGAGGNGEDEDEGGVRGDYALSVATSTLPAGTRIRFKDGAGARVALVSVPARPEGLAIETVEQIVHLSGPNPVSGMVVIPPGAWEAPETDEPVARIRRSDPFYGAAVSGATLVLGDSTEVRVSAGNSLSWEVELPSELAEGDGGGRPMPEGRLEIDYVLEGESAARADSGPVDGAAPGDSGPSNGAPPGAPADRRPRAELTLEGAGSSASLRADLAAGAGLIALPAPALGFVPERVRVASTTDGFAIVRVEWHPQTARPPASDIGPIPADLATILTDYPQDAWRRSDFEIFSWSAYPRILVFDTADYETQSRLFKRLAFFVEKRGFRGSILSDAELSGRHGWNAHNYRPEGLAAFFNAAQSEGAELNAEEVLLREILLANGVIHRDDGSYRPGTGGVLSISQESYPILRELLVTHEALHGVFYEEPGFRDDAWRIWDGLSEEERSFWRQLLGYMTYDPADEYLMVNEFQAYLLQQPLERARAYLRGQLAQRFMAARPGMREEVETFLARYPDAFVRPARAVAASLRAHSPIRAGRVVLLH